jgi:hypothetical protein
VRVPRPLVVTAGQFNSRLHLAVSHMRKSGFGSCGFRDFKLRQL